MIACEREGFRGIGVEAQPDYTDIALARIRKAAECLTRLIIVRSKDQIRCQGDVKFDSFGKKTSESVSCALIPV